MTMLKQYDQEVYGRMEFLAYFIIAFALLGLVAFIYACINWLIG